MCFFLIVYTQCSSPDTCDIFHEPIPVSNAYVLLFQRLSENLKHCDLLILKEALFNEVNIPYGVELENQLKEQINEAKSSSELLNALDGSHCCNWLDTRLFEVLAYASESPRAVELIKAYQKQLFPRKLVDVLSKMSQHAEAKKNLLLQYKQ